MPIFIFLSFFYFYNKTNKNIDDKINSIKDKNIVYEIWKNNLGKTDVSADLEKMQISRNGKIYFAKDLKESQQELLKIMLLYKIKKDAKRFGASLSGAEIEFINKLNKDADEKIAQSKEKLYNLKGEDTHKFDKFFLDNLDVYFFN